MTAAMVTVPPEPANPDGAGVGPLLAALQNSAHAQEMAAPSRLYDLLATSDDPLWREIGLQLQQGRMSLREVLQVDAYRQHLHRGLAHHRFQETMVAARTYLTSEPGDG